MITPTCNDGSLDVWMDGLLVFGWNGHLVVKTIDILCGQGMALECVRVCGGCRVRVIPAVLGKTLSSRSYEKFPGAAVVFIPPCISSSKLYM